jgi:hypothetical protein
MKTKSKIFAGLAVLLSAALALIFILKSPSREDYVVESSQAPEDFEVFKGVAKANSMAGRCSPAASTAREEVFVYPGEPRLRSRSPC